MSKHNAVMQELKKPWVCKKCSNTQERNSFKIVCNVCGEKVSRKTNEAMLMDIAQQLHFKNPLSAMHVAKSIVVMCDFSYDVAMSVCELAICRKESIPQAYENFCNELLCISSACAHLSLRKRYEHWLVTHGRQIEQVQTYGKGYFLGQPVSLLQDVRDEQSVVCAETKLEVDDHLERELEILLFYLNMRKCNKLGH